MGCVVSLMQNFCGFPLESAGETGHIWGSAVLSRCCNDWRMAWLVWFADGIDLAGRCGGSNPLRHSRPSLGAAVLVDLDPVYSSVGWHRGLSLHRGATVAGQALVAKPLVEAENSCATD